MSQKLIFVSAGTGVLLLMTFSLALTWVGNPALAATTGMAAAGLGAWAVRRCLTAVLPSGPTTPGADRSPGSRPAGGEGDNTSEQS